MIHVSVLYSTHTICSVTLEIEPKGQTEERTQQTIHIEDAAKEPYGLISYLGMSKNRLLIFVFSVLILSYPLVVTAWDIVFLYW